jgi:hypothetical protein
MNHRDLPMVQGFVERLGYRIDMEQIDDLHEMEAPPARTRQSAFAALGAGQGMHFGWSGAG